MTTKLFDGRALAVSSVKMREDFQAHNIKCHHCSKIYTSLSDFTNITILDSSPSVSAAMGQGSHSRYTIVFQCTCKAIITVMVPLSGDEFQEVITDIQQRLKGQ
ncbi:MAG: hypothetical protein KF846_00015 [Cyclobacteriaceae bacterium]|nr:hypothetical protein [Cyclobacteriaceae bacterium]